MGKQLAYNIRIRVSQFELKRFFIDLWDKYVSFNNNLNARDYKFELILTYVDDISQNRMCFIGCLVPSIDMSEDECYEVTIIADQLVLG